MKAIPQCIKHLFVRRSPREEVSHQLAHAELERLEATHMREAWEWREKMLQRRIARLAAEKQAWGEAR